MTNLIDQLLSLLPEKVLATRRETARGLSFVPNDDMLIGPRFLILINYPMPEEDRNWAQLVQPFLGGANEEACWNFFNQCNGFSIGGRFTAWGILTPDRYKGLAEDDPLPGINTPYCLYTNAYGSYPEHAPTKGYFIGQINKENETVEINDIMNEDGSITSGEYRKNTQVLEEFDGISSWIEARTREAIEIMYAEGLLKSET